MNLFCFRAVSSAAGGSPGAGTGRGAGRVTLTTPQGRRAFAARLAPRARRR